MYCRVGYIEEVANSRCHIGRFALGFEKFVVYCSDLQGGCGFCGICIRLGGGWVALGLDLTCGRVDCVQ